MRRGRVLRYPLMGGMTMTMARSATKLLAIALALAVPAAIAAAQAKDGEKPAAGAGVTLEQAKFEPGGEVRIDDPSLGGQGYYLVYLPKDYAPDRAWPAVFCYHGVNGAPTVWPFKDVVGGKGFVVIGMCYAAGPGREAYGQVSKDSENLRRLVPALAKQLKVDPRQLFIGGFSQGAYMGSDIAEATAELWAGIALMGGGRHSGGSVKNASQFKGKPMYIAAGEKDPHLGAAQGAADAYRKQGAEVTFETYAGMGHAVDTASKVFADWLWSNGPLKQAVADVVEAKKLQAAGRLGQAYAKFSRAATAVPGDREPCKEAAKAAEAIAKEAEAKLAAADEAVKAKRYKDGAAALSRVAATYGGSKFGDQAAKQLAAVKADPTIQEEIEAARQNEQAAILLKQAQAAEQAKDYAQAMRLYEQMVATCPKSGLCASAKAQLETLKGDEAVQASIRQRDADRECRSWLAMADNFIGAERPDKAKEYLQKIVDKYGDTDWGRQARERLAKIKL